ncbi:hypothetical protein [Pectobacterium actinidiae]|uniref:hypothetical protein n=1 Tax=Pectobacterium actinidiae TaxID=1507808 RepID=UPI003826B606
MSKELDSQQSADLNLEPLVAASVACARGLQEMVKPLVQADQTMRSNECMRAPLGRRMRSILMVGPGPDEKGSGAVWKRLWRAIYFIVFFLLWVMLSIPLFFWAMSEPLL